MMKESPQCEVLLEREEAATHDMFTAYLCLEILPDGSLQLSTRSRDALAEVCEYIDEDGEANLPEMIGGQKVYGTEGCYIVGEELSERETIVIDRDRIDKAATWLAERAWNRAPGFDKAWARIQAALG